jgi:hypothetical protein
VGRKQLLELLLRKIEAFIYLIECRLLVSELCSSSENSFTLTTRRETEDPLLVAMVLFVLWTEAKVVASKNWCGIRENEAIAIDPFVLRFVAINH